jgi:hypothetical protein
VNTPSSDYRPALKAIRDALTLPYAATAGGDEVRAKLLEQRLMYVTAFLRDVLDDPCPPFGLTWEIRFLTERISRHPAAGQYVTDDQARAAMAQGASWIEATTLPDPTTKGDRS